MDEQWTDAKAHRRATLVDLKYKQGLSDEESAEFERLQEEFGNYQDKICPLPSGQMNIYKISQTSNKNKWDVYRAAIVVAATEDAARLIHPCGYQRGSQFGGDQEWVPPEQVHVEFLGVAADGLVKGVVMSDYCAG